MPLLTSSPHELDATPLELASGAVLGASGAGPLRADRALAPVAALEQAVLPGLLHPPCVVSFSGGRDSSIVLAAACGVARREGLPLPVPVTLRFPDDRWSLENEWQERVLSCLGIRDWIFKEFTDELELLGPVARNALALHGPLWPPNAHVHTPIFEQATGGSVLTGLDGDGLFEGWRGVRLGDVLAGRCRPVPRDALRAAYAAAPARLRARYLHRREPVDFPWLHAPFCDALGQAWAREKGSEPRAWRRRVDWWSRRRYLAVARRSLDRLAARHNARVVHPLLDSGFLSAVARLGGRCGFGNRVSATKSVFAGLLPDDVLGRTSKAILTTSLWGPRTREFCAEWDGITGIDPDVVRAEALRNEWREEFPDFRTASPVQVAWLATRAPLVAQAQQPAHQHARPSISASTDAE